MRAIEHSGVVWMSLGIDRNTGCQIWPIDEYLVRRKHGKNVAERIARLNRSGKVEGERPRGWHPTWRRSIFMDAVPVSVFCARHGSAAYRALPRSAFIKLHGRRRAISGLAYVSLGFHAHH